MPRLATEMSGLKGREVVIKIGHEDVQGYVVNADRTVGITIHSLADDQPIHCTNRKEILHLLRNCREGNRIYHKVFSATVEDIFVGTMYHHRISSNGQIKRHEKANEDPFSSMSRCPFTS